MSELKMYPRPKISIEFSLLTADKISVHFLRTLQENGFSIIAHTDRNTTDAFTWIRQNFLADYISEVTNDKTQAIYSVDRNDKISDRLLNNLISLKELWV